MRHARWVRHCRRRVAGAVREVAAQARAEQRRGVRRRDNPSERLELSEGLAALAAATPAVEARLTDKQRTALRLVNAGQSYAKAGAQIGVGDMCVCLYMKRARELYPEELGLPAI